MQQGQFVRTSAGGGRRLAWLLLPVTALVVLYVFPPEQYGFYPRCPFFEATGWLCPGCGGTRALAALVHGHVAEAWRLNPLVVTLLPVAIGYGLAWVWRGAVRVPQAAWVGVGMLAVVFGVWRNL